MRQTTEFAEQLCELVVATFARADENKLANLDELKQKAQVSQQDWEDTLAYCAQVGLRPKPFFFPEEVSS